MKVLTSTHVLGYFTLQVALFILCEGYATTFHQAALRFGDMRLDGK